MIEKIKSVLANKNATIQELAECVNAIDSLVSSVDSDFRDLFEIDLGVGYIGNDGDDCWIGCHLNETGKFQIHKQLLEGTIPEIRHALFTFVENYPSIVDKFNNLLERVENSRDLVVSKLIGIEVKTTLFDIAKYILEECGQMTSFKLQRLVYYCYVWCLVLYNIKIFEEPIKVEDSMLIIEELWKVFSPSYMVDEAILDGKGLIFNKLGSDLRNTIDRVIDNYAKMSAGELSDLVSKEFPYILAKNRADHKVLDEDIVEYYSRFTESPREKV